MPCSFPVREVFFSNRCLTLCSLVVRITRRPCWLYLAVPNEIDLPHWIINRGFHPTSMWMVVDLAPRLCALRIWVSPERVCFTAGARLPPMFFTGTCRGHLLSFSPAFWFHVGFFANIFEKFHVDPKVFCC